MPGCHSAAPSVADPSRPRLCSTLSGRPTTVGRPVEPQGLENHWRSAEPGSSRCAAGSRSRREHRHSASAQPVPVDKAPVHNIGRTPSGGADLATLGSWRWTPLPTSDHPGTARRAAERSRRRLRHMGRRREPTVVRSSVKRPVDRGMGRDIRAQGPPPTPISMPAAWVAGRALRVPTGAASGRPFPRPAAAGPRRVVGSGQECGDGRRVPSRRRLQVALKAASGTPRS